jgi:hypothetical protein
VSNRGWIHRLLGFDNRLIGSQRDWPSAMKHQEQSGRGRQESQVVSIPHAISVAAVGRKRTTTWSSIFTTITNNGEALAVSLTIGGQVASAPDVYSALIRGSDRSIYYPNPHAVDRRWIAGTTLGPEAKAP